jgi:hypothetical protein
MSFHRNRDRSGPPGFLWQPAVFRVHIRTKTDIVMTTIVIGIVLSWPSI